MTFTVPGRETFGSTKSTDVLVGEPEMDAATPFTVTLITELGNTPVAVILSPELAFAEDLLSEVTRGLAATTLRVNWAEADFPDPSVMVTLKEPFDSVEEEPVT